MNDQTALMPRTGRDQQALLQTLEQLLSLDAVALKPALDHASGLLAEVLAAEKVDAFLYEPAIDSLVAAGTSPTPMGKRQIQLGLDRLPLSNGGRAVESFQTGRPYLNGRVDQDPMELAGVKHGLGVRSTMVVPLLVNGVRRGVVQVDSIQVAAFSEDDVLFLEAVAHWIGAVTHRAELVEQIRREAEQEARRQAAEELLTVLAHDLGNHLTPLLARVGLLRRRARREEQPRYLQDAEELARSLARLQRLITDLLDVGRLEAGLFTLALQPLDLVALAQESAAVLSTEGCPIIVDAPDELVITGDPDRLRQALENLLTNACKHSPPGATVEVRVGQEIREEQPWAMLTVRDSGAGIPPDLLPRLFQRFAPGPGSQGLGLGLYLVHEIATLHSGTLTVESAPGQGTTFCLVVPVTPPGAVGQA